eukprot:7390350-Prymnesium_polylepis.1
MARVSRMWRSRRPVSSTCSATASTRGTWAAVAARIYTVSSRSASLGLCHAAAESEEAYRAKPYE